MNRKLVVAVFAGLVLASLAAGGVTLRSFDLGWQLGAGEWILEHGRPPQQDMLAHTSDAAPWVDHEWLFQALLAMAVRQAGLAGAWLVKQGMVLAAVLLPAFWLLRRGTAPWLVAVLSVIALNGARARFFARPELAGLVALPLLLILLMMAASRADAEGRGRKLRDLLPLPLLVALWVNCHPSVLLGVGLIAVYGAGLWLSGRPQAATSVLLAGLMAALALLANPYGAEILRVPLNIRSALQVEGITNPEWGSSMQREFWFFWLVAVGWLVALAAALLRRRRVDLPLASVGTVLLVLAAMALRLQSIFFIALPLLAQAMGSRPTPSSRRHGAWQPVLAVAAPLVGAIFFLALPHGGPLGTGLAPGRFPEAMAASFQRLGVRGPIYNPVRFGGYLAWRLSPEPVFIDGRNEIHGPLLASMAACRAAANPTCWDGILDGFGVEAALVEYDPRPLRVRLPDGRFTSMVASEVYFRRSRWALLDWDDTAMLLVRRGGLNSALVDLEDRELTPDNVEGFAQRLAIGKVNREQALEEAQRRLEMHPASRRAAVLEALLRQGAAEEQGTGSRP